MPLLAIPAHGLLAAVTLTTQTAPVVKAATTHEALHRRARGGRAGGALIVLCLAWAAARWWAYEPRWRVSLRHCVAEASWRLSGTWEEFADWAQAGVSRLNRIPL